MKHIGIECESIEQDTYGVARIILKTLEEISRRPELAQTHRFHLYFKSRIPDYPFLDNPIFIKEIIWQPLPYRSFVLYYYVFLPIRLWFARLNAMYFPNYMLPIIFWGKSLVLLTDDIYYEMRSPDQRPHHRLAYWVFGNWAARFATKIMAISETSKRELVRLFKINPDRIAVNHLGVETFEAKESRPHERDYILFVGQAFPRRHLKETLLAFEKIAPEFPNLDFIFVGTDKYSPPIIDDLINEINKRLDSSRAIHRKNVSDEELSSLYKHAKVVTYISNREAFGLPPFEALAQGGIPVTADNPLSHELFGNNAFMVPEPITTESVVKTLKDSITNTAQREIVQKMAPAITSRFNWRSHADRFLDIIRTF